MLGLRAYNHALGANPVEFVQRDTGSWILNLLFVTLAVTPFVRLTGRSAPLKYRRMIGLFCFFYACLHLSTYLVLDQFFDFHAIWKDVAKRRFITSGFAAYLCLLPLALTSTDASIRRLGRRWGRLHRLIYPAAVFGVIHFLWMVKRDWTHPLEYAAVLALLLGYRVIARLRAAETIDNVPR